MLILNQQDENENYYLSLESIMFNIISNKWIQYVYVLYNQYRECQSKVMRDKRQTTYIRTFLTNNINPKICGHVSFL